MKNGSNYVDPWVGGKERDQYQNHLQRIPPRFIFLVLYPSDFDSKISEESKKE
jgi:hypothetical protein